MRSARFSHQAENHTLQQLARHLLADGSELALPTVCEPSASASEPGTGPALAPAYVLRLEELLGDGNGDVVLLNDAGLTHLAIATDADVVKHGIALDHMVANGEDVSGFAYVTFATGLTMYYPEGVDLAVLPHA